MAEKKAAKKAPSKKAGAGRKYSPAASASVEREMKAMKQGELRSGSGAKVTNPKQAIAIALSEARREGDEAPPPANRNTGRKAGGANAPTKKAASKKSAAKKTTGKAAARKSPAKKTAAKKTAAKK